MFGKIKLGKTILNGLKRAFKININEQTEDEDISDSLAKATKILARLITFAVLYKFFPEVWEAAFHLIVGG